jgi:hypothetical protein
MERPPARRWRSTLLTSAALLFAAAPLPLAAAERSQDPYAQAMGLYRAGRRAEAVRVLRQAVAHDRTDEETRQFLQALTAEERQVQQLRRILIGAEQRLKRLTEELNRQRREAEGLLTALRDTR